MHILQDLLHAWHGLYDLKFFEQFLQNNPDGIPNNTQHKL